MFQRISEPRICKNCNKTFQCKDGFNMCLPCRYVEKCKKHNKKCLDCNVAIGPKSIRCKTCNAKSRKGSKNPLWKGRTYTSKGYVMQSGYHNHPNANSRGQIKEHTLVMSQIIGRPLLKGESVHHKNGVRDDNRPENLELWVTPQPRGIRHSDLIDWAIEILKTHAPENLIQSHVKGSDQ